MKKLYDLAVKTGSYQKDGETKNRYANIGVIMEGTDGNRFLFINRHFNPAGVPFKEGSESIIVSMFKPKVADDQQSPPPPVSDDDIPF
jgi:hypothetical protein